MNRGKRVFNQDINLEFLKQELEALDLIYPHFEKTSENLYEWWRSFTGAWLVDTGLLDREAYNKMIKLEPHYVPFFRDSKQYTLNKSGKVVEAAKRGFTDHRAPIKKSSLKGSADPILNPIESMLIQIEEYVTTVNRRNVMLKIHEMYINNSSEDTGLGYLMKKVAPAMQAESVDVSDKKIDLVWRMLVDLSVQSNSKTLKEAIKNKDYNKAYNIAKTLGFTADRHVDEVFQDVITDFQALSMDKESNIISVKDDKGKIHHYEIFDVYLLEALLSMDTTNIDAVTRQVQAFRRAFQSIITTLNPLFWARNIARDFFQGIVASDISLHKYPKALAQAFYDEVKKGEWSEMYRQEGGGYASPVGADRNALEESMFEIIPGLREKHKGRAAMEAIEKFSDAIEQAPRIAEFRNYIEKYGDSPGSRARALYEAQDVTVNFSRKGQIMQRWYGAWIPFLNASIQGIDKFARLHSKENRVKTATRAMSTIMLLQALQMAIFRDDPEYDKISDYIKDNYWILPYKDVKGKYVRIPKPRELAILYGSAFERAFNSIVKKEGPEAWNNFSDALISNFVPQLRSIAAPILDIEKNKTWYGGEIVPYKYRRLQTDEQYTSKTSSIAKNIAKVISDESKFSSPMAIDYIINQYSGFLGKIIIPATDDLRGNAFDFLGRAFTTDTAYSNNIVSEFYDTLEEMDKQKTTYTSNRKVKGYYSSELHEKFKDSAEKMKGLYNIKDELVLLDQKKGEEREKAIKEFKKKYGIPASEEFEIDTFGRIIQFNIRTQAELANKEYDKLVK